MKAVEAVAFSLAQDTQIHNVDLGDCFIGDEGNNVFPELLQCELF